MNGRKVQVLISHSFADEAAAAALRRLLAQAGVGTWQPPNVLYGDQSGYIADQERGLRESHLVLVLWSAEASRSHWVHLDIAKAVSYKRVVPVLLEAALPRSAFASYASQDAQTVAQKLSTLVRWAPGIRSVAFDRYYRYDQN